jgi:hypothetical protein
MEKLRYSSAILVLGIRWRLVVSFTYLPRYTLYPLLDRRLIESERYGEQKNILLMPRIEREIV